MLLRSRCTSTQLLSFPFLSEHPSNASNICVLLLSMESLCYKCTFIHIHRSYARCQASLSTPHSAVVQALNQSPCFRAVRAFGRALSRLLFACARLSVALFIGFSERPNTPLLNALLSTYTRSIPFARMIQISCCR